MIVATSTRKETAVETRELIAKWLEPRWKDPAREVGLIQAVAKSGRAEYANQVLAARFSTTPEVKAAAEAAIKELKLDDGQKSGRRSRRSRSKRRSSWPSRRRGTSRSAKSCSSGMSCVKCHTTRKDQPPRGPFPGTIANTYKREALAEAILIPSKTLAQGFVTNVFALDDGTTVTGFVVSEAADKVTIRNADGVEREIPTKSIDERAKQNVSLMPDGIVKELTIRELASLIDYLESLPKQQ